jgi:uncharacterized damage-inducible protein DinB
MNQPEPWLRGTLTDVPAVQRAVLHALQLAEEDLFRWCGELSDQQLSQESAGLASIAFHIRHIARSVDRLLTYAEGESLSSAQRTALQTEADSIATKEQLFQEVTIALERAAQRIRVFPPEALEQPRSVGTKQLPTTVAGLLIHIADHTLRHVGQAITTAKIVTSRVKPGTPV